MEWKAKEKMENPLSFFVFEFFLWTFFFLFFAFFCKVSFEMKNVFFDLFFFSCFSFFLQPKKKANQKSEKKWKKVKKFSKKKSEEKKQKKSKNKKMLLCFAKIEKNWKRQSFLSKFLWTKVFSQARSFNHSELAKNFFFHHCFVFLYIIFLKERKKT